MKIKIYFICFLFLICLIASLSATASEIKTIHNLDEISTNDFSNKTLVMFDIDDVLIYPKDALLQNWRSEWKPEGMRKWTPEEDTIAWMNEKFQIMDPSGPKLIDRLNEKGVPVIGFTTFAMDQTGMVKSIPEWRSKQLEELGLHFKIDKEIIFPTQDGFVPPSFEKGVLYCGNFYKKDKDNQGKILSLYLDWIDWTPEQVVFVNDRRHNLETVKNELERRKISFLGFLYIPKNLDPIDENVARLQHETIIKHKQWLSDEEAKKLFLLRQLNHNSAPSKTAGAWLFDKFLINYI
jgi:hypothetical protein